MTIASDGSHPAITVVYDDQPERPLCELPRLSHLPLSLAPQVSELVAASFRLCSESSPDQPFSISIPTSIGPSFRCLMFKPGRCGTYLPLTCSLLTPSVCNSDRSEKQNVRRANVDRIIEKLGGRLQS